MNYKIIDIKTVGTEGKGELSFFESGKDIPFDIKRIYYTYHVPEKAERGGHAHIKLSQLLICPYGEIELSLDDGDNRVSILLNDPSKGVLIEGLIWREMTWKKEGSLLMVAASDYYKEEDYIRNYSDFINVRNSILSGN